MENFQYPERQQDAWPVLKLFGKNPTFSCVFSTADKYFVFLYKPCSQRVRSHKPSPLEKQQSPGPEAEVPSQAA